MLPRQIHQKIARSVGTRSHLARGGFFRLLGANHDLPSQFSCPVSLPAQVSEQNRYHAAEQQRRSSSSPQVQRAGREHKYVDMEAGIAHSLADAVPGVRPIEDAPDNVLQFGNISSNTIRYLCQKHVPGWSSIPQESFCIDQLCEGLSNQNFKVYLTNGNVKPGLTPCVLFRVHGKDAGTLYNLDRELEIVKMLSAYEIGPAVFGNGDGWRIEEWHFSVPLPNRKMRNPAVFAQVAAHMGRMHKLSSRKDFPSAIASADPMAFQRMVDWGEGCKAAAQAFTDPNCKRQIEAFNVDEVLEEREWITRFAVADDPRIHGSGLDVVFCHWDSQENNILQTQYGLRFIDFEYAGMEYQAFDIATYFAECTMDYLVNTHPFYKVSLADFPMESEQRLFCSIYLSEYLETDVYPDDLSVSVLMERVRRFVLVVHYVWSLWSVIRAPQAPTYGDFDYLGYAQHRWFMYKWAKRELLHNKGGA